MSENPPNIVVVEDEKQIRRFVRSALEAEGCRVYEAERGKQGLVEAGTRKPDLVILDLGLPDMDGIEFIRDLRGWSAVPILILSARSTENDKIVALDTGADDYLSKPFGVGELLARVRALLRRQVKGDGGGATVSFGAVQVDFSLRLVTRNGAPVHLTQIEYRLLGLLLANPGKVLTHRHLLHEVWNAEQEQNMHILQVNVSNLRRKIERDAARPEYILTEPGVGYRLRAGASG